MATLSNSTTTSLLQCFPTDGSELSELHEEFVNDGQDVAPNKTFLLILQAIKRYLSGAAKVETQSSHGSRPPVVRELAAILDWDEEAMGLKRVKLFSEAFKYWPPKPNQDQATSPAYITVQALCLMDPEMAFKKTERAHKNRDGYDMKEGDDVSKEKDDITPFAAAAKVGAVELIKVMITELLDFLKRQYPDIQESRKKAQDEYLSEPQGEGENAKTAFRLAAEERKYDVLEFLLHDFPGLADKDSIMSTIKQTARNRDATLDSFKLILNHADTTADDAIWGKIWEEAVKGASLQLVRYLLKGTKTMGHGRFITYENARFVMEKGNKDMWKAFDHRDRQAFLEMPDQNLIHTAVQSGNADMVEEIIREFPDQVEVERNFDGKLCYPIHLLRKTGQFVMASDRYDRIRDALVHAMIRSTSEHMGIRDLRRIFRDAEVEVDALCLHLENIDTDEQAFSEYVQWLQSEDSTTNNIFKFESILRYANFPDLHSQTQDMPASLRLDHFEVKTVIEWLRKRRVKQILKLSVPDRLFRPHSDADVRECVVSSKVRVLDWRKLDIYLGNLVDGDNLQELHLYSSGNQSVHDQWYRELPKFSNLRKLYVFVVVDVLSEKRVEEAKAELQEKLDEINRKLSNRWIGSFPDLDKEVAKVPVMKCHWKAHRRLRRYRNLAQTTDDVVGPNLAAFISKYKSATSRKLGMTRTRVALIDSGIVAVGGRTKAESPTRADEPGIDNPEAVRNNADPYQRSRVPWSDVTRRIVNGKSFVSTGDDDEQVWWHASEPHGTQMARLICSIDPCCELSVLKVAETRDSGISANTVAQAIHWAIRKGVDVISLSLVAYTDTEKMSEAIMKAWDQDIVVLSSTADEGVGGKRPITGSKNHRNNNHVFTIAACDRWGNLLDRSQKDGYDYRFIGHNIHVGQVPFLKSTECISGSSAATAIAAGTASLIIACHRMTQSLKKRPRWRCELVNNIFRKMLDGPEELRYVVLENLCGKGAKLENVNFQQVVNASFSL